MAMLGKAAIAMWWDMAAKWRDEFEDWHSHEHFPERMSVPGFLRGSRWASAAGDEGFFVLYELEAYETLASPAYLQRLNQPTPWSTKLMPQHRNMVRSQCRVLDSAGGALGRYALTVRLSPRAGCEDSLRAHLAAHAAQVVAQAGITGAHLLMTQAPALSETTEQKIRGGRDRQAAWIYIVNGYAINAMTACEADVRGAAEVLDATTQSETCSALYALSHTLEAAGS